MSKGFVMITVDTEAQPVRAAKDHVERLIYGRFGEEELGIGHMMNVADKYSKKVTFFVDIVADRVYPEEIKRVCEDIVSRGHDVQLHAHPEFADDEFWEELGVPKQAAMNRWNFKQAKGVIGWMMEECEKWGIPTPVAIRGGGYRYNTNTLLASGELGISLDLNYNHLHRKIPLKEPSQPQPFNYGPLPVFRWSNGMIEVPVSSMEMGEDPGHHISRRRFDEGFLRDFGEGLNNRIARYFDEARGTGVLVLLMHSWSFLDLNRDNGHYELGGYEKRDGFERFLRDLPEDFKVITASEMGELVNSGEIETVMEISTEVARYEPKEEKI
jgi:hypothetical protein